MILGRIEKRLDKAQPEEQHGFRARYCGQECHSFLPWFLTQVTYSNRYFCVLVGSFFLTDGRWWGRSHPKKRAIDTWRLTRFIKQPCLNGRNKRRKAQQRKKKKRSKKKIKIRHIGGLSTSGGYQNKKNVRRWISWSHCWTYDLLMTFCCLRHLPLKQPGWWMHWWLVWRRSVWH